MHFVLTHAHPGRTSQSVTHPKIALGQAHLTPEFFGDGFPEKKLQLVGMSILLILLSPRPECYSSTPPDILLPYSNYQRAARPHPWRHGVLW
jgi:hypothetical protein